MADDEIYYEDTYDMLAEQEAQFQQEEAYFYHTLGDFQYYVRDLGAKYVINKMSDDVRQLLKGALND